MGASDLTRNLFLSEDLEDANATEKLAEGDLPALRAVADWTDTFVALPNRDLGRPGTVCPFVPGSLERRILWFAPEHIADLALPDVVELMRGYRRLFLDSEPTDGDDAQYKTIIVVFTDLPADRAQGVFDGVLDELATPSYESDGILFGPFFEGNPGTALYNPDFRPFQSPVPFLFVRNGVVSDWKFFLDDEEQVDRWADRYQGDGARALAEELRPLPWREHPGS
jgi:hypothetical protein